jgi:hypothetical protein
VPVVVAALVTVVTGLAIGLDIDRDSAQGPSTAVHSGGVDDAAPGNDRSTDAVPAASTGPGVLVACQRQYAAQTPVLGAAARSIRQWEVHVGAMNQLVAGEITLDQASAFWSRTRIGAQGRVDDFRRAEDDYTAGTHQCPAPRDTGPTGLRECSRTVELRDRVIGVARRSIATWAMHVRDLERLRTGKLDPAKASAMWQKSWRRGQDQIDAYRDALRSAGRAVPCQP